MPFRSPSFGVTPSSNHHVPAVFQKKIIIQIFFIPNTFSYIERLKSFHYPHWPSLMDHAWHTVGRVPHPPEHHLSIRNVVSPMQQKEMCCSYCFQYEMALVVVFNGGTGNHTWRWFSDIGTYSYVRSVVNDKARDDATAWRIIAMVTQGHKQ